MLVVAKGAARFMFISLFRNPCLKYLRSPAGLFRQEGVDLQGQPVRQRDGHDQRVPLAEIVELVVIRLSKRDPRRAAGVLLDVSGHFVALAPDQVVAPRSRA